MEQKIQYFEKVETDNQETFVQNQNHCILCGETLELHHIQDRDQNLIHEEAFCPSCEVKARDKIYNLN